MARILVTAVVVDPPSNPALARLRAAGHDVEVVDGIALRNPEALAAALVGVHATIASVEPYTASVLERATDLRVIARSGVGYDAIDLEAATRLGIAVCTTPGTNHDAVADFAVALILACTRHLFAGDAWVRSGRWNGSPLGMELRRATVGVVGTGLIGRGVVQRLAAFGPRLLGHDPVEHADLVAHYGLRYVALGDLLAESDVVTLHTPLLPETHHLLDRSALARMKPTAFLVNTARGPLVDEAALVEALRAGRLAGAALDVFEREPLPADSPLRAVDNAILQPHQAGVTRQSRAAMLEMAVENVLRVLAGEPPLSCLNGGSLSARRQTPAPEVGPPSAPRP